MFHFVHPSHVTKPHSSHSQNPFTSQQFLNDIFSQNLTQSNSNSQEDEQDDDLIEYALYDQQRRQTEQVALEEQQRQRRLKEQIAIIRARQLAAQQQMQRERAAKEQAMATQRARLQEQALMRKRQQEAQEQEFERQVQAELQRRKWYAMQQQQQQYQQQLAQAEALEQKKRELEQKQAQEEKYQEMSHPLLQLLFGQTQPQQQSQSESEKAVLVEKCEDKRSSASTNDPLVKLLQSLFGTGVNSSQPESTQAKPEQPPVQSEADVAEPSTAPDSIAEPIVEKDESPADPIEEEQVQVEDPIEASLEPTAEAVESAAEVLQGHYRTHLHRREALSLLKSLMQSFQSKKASFAVPDKLSFQTSPPTSSTSTSIHDSTATCSLTPKLAFSSNNAPFLTYEDFLVGLMTRVDEIQSGGDRTIKKQRKELVKQIEAELTRLDSLRDEAWEKENEHDQEQELEPLLPEDALEQPQAKVAAESTSNENSSATLQEPASPRLTPANLASFATGDDVQKDESDTDSTLSVDSIPGDVMAEVMRRMNKLGQQVNSLEEQEKREAVNVSLPAPVEVN